MKILALVLSMFLGSVALADGTACEIDQFDMSTNGNSNCASGSMGYVVSGPNGIGRFFINDSYCGHGANDPHDTAYAQARAYVQTQLDAKNCSSLDDESGN